MVTSRETPQPSDPIPDPPSNGHDLLSFPILKPRSKRRPAKYPQPPLPSSSSSPTTNNNPSSTVTDDQPEPVEERPWNLRSCRGSISRLASWRRNKHNHRPQFSVPLSTDEIEEDIYAVTGSRARRRPKKRPRVVQKQIDLVFPGLWLTEVSMELYRVPEER